MGLGFLVPLFLAGLAALAIPVVVHLLNRERKEIVRFPSLMFLERVPYRAIRRQTIRHPLLLALRALAIILLVAAFARPFFQRDPGLAMATAGGTERVILLDRSYSMARSGRWERALRAVREELENSGPSDRVSLVAFDERVSLAFASSVPPAAGGVTDSLAPGSRGTRLGPALAAAREVLAGSSLPRREVVIVSDLQRNAWDGRSEGRLPSNVETRIIDLSDSATGNALVAGVEVSREMRGGQVMGSVVANIRNQGPAATSRRAVLEIQGRVQESRTVTVPAQGTATVRFAALPVPPRPAAASVRMDPDVLAADDIFHFTLSRDQSLPILVLSRMPGSRSLFLRRALGLGRDPPFDLTIQAPATVSPASLGGYAVIVLNNLDFPGGALGAALRERVERGAGLIVILGEAADPSRWTAADAALLPATVPAMVDRTGDHGGRIAALERSHHVFQPFAGPRSGDFSASRFLRYRPLEPGDSATALAWFDDGHVALVEGRAGHGRVLVWGSTMDDFWNDLVLQPVFLPFVHALVRHAAGFTPDPLWRTVGQRVRLADSDSAAEPPVLVRPGGGRQRLEPGSGAVELHDPGFYEVQNNARETARLLAVNVDRAESETARWNPDELRAAITSGDTLATAGGAAVLTAAERESRQRVWWFLLVAAAMVLLAESLLASRISRTRLGLRQEPGRT